VSRLTIWSRRVLPLALLAATALFVLGVSLEPGEDGHHDEGAAAAVERAEGERAESEAGAEAGERPDSDEASEERVLGLDLESPLLVGAAVVVSLGLAVVAWSRSERRWFVVIAVVAAGFTVLDVAEIVHQLDEDRGGLAALAGSVAALHALAAVLAGHGASQTQAAVGLGPVETRR
jgi:hypothetical protein